MLKRRHLLHAASGASVALLLSACGGGGSSDERMPDGELPDPDERVLSEGIELGPQSHLPVNVAADLNYLTAPLDMPVQASVKLGEQAQAGVALQFFDIHYQPLGGAITNAQGMARLEGVQVRRFMLVEAQTSMGVLRGMKFLNEASHDSVVYVDVLQSTLVSLANRLLEMDLAYNVSANVVNDYFSLPRHINLLNVGHAYASVDQRLMFAEMKQQGAALPDFVDGIVQDIVTHLAEPNHSNERYVNHAARESVKASPLIRDITRVVLTGLSGYISDPFASTLASFAIGKFMGHITPVEPDPFEEVRSRFNEVDAKLNRIEELIQENRFKDMQMTLAASFDRFRRLQHSKSNTEMYPESSGTDHVDLYLKDLLKMAEDAGDGLSVASLYHLAEDKMMGCGQYRQKDLNVLDVLMGLIQKKFYSYEGQERYKAVLEYYVTLQSNAFLLLGGAYIYQGMVAQNQAGADAQKISDDVKRKLKRLEIDYQAIVASVNRIEVEDLPDRVNVDHQHKTVWVGGCESIAELKSLWPEDKKIQYRYSIGTDTVCIDRCRIVDVFFDETYQGTGATGWQGPKQTLHMQGSGKLSVTNTVYTSFAWRLPELDEVNVSFFNEARKYPKDIDEYALANGFSDYSVIQKKTLDVFRNPVTHQLLQVANRFRKAGGTFFNKEEYLDMTVFDFSNYKIIDSRKATTAYGSGKNFHVLTYFPVASVNDAFLDKHLPWRVIERVRSQGQLCRVA